MHMDKKPNKIHENLILAKINNLTVQYVLLKALPPVCMKYTARGESRVANIA